MIIIHSVTSQLVPDAKRMQCVDRLFGLSYVLKLEPTVFNMAEHLAPEYTGAYWQFQTLSNNGFFMFPRLSTVFDVHCENGFTGRMSAEALGLSACLMAYSHLSFGGDDFADTCGRLFHLLREFVFQHSEAKAVLRATD